MLSLLMSFSKLKTTSLESIGLEGTKKLLLWNSTPVLRRKVYSRPSPLTSQDWASDGRNECGEAGSCSIRRSNMLAADEALVWFRSSIHGEGVLSSDEAQKERPPPGRGGLLPQPVRRAAAASRQRIPRSDFEFIPQL